MNFKRFFMFFLLLVTSVTLVGCAGDKGVKGDKGEQGIPGVQGPAGDKGETGNQGDQGAQGPKGEKGDKGDKGEAGDPGDEVEFRMNEGWLQQKYVTEADTEWRNVFYFGNLSTWVTRYTIELDLDGGTLEGGNQLTDLAYQSTVTLPVPTKENAIFAGWTDGKEVYNDTYTVLKNTELKALWEAAEYTVIFKGEGAPQAGGYASIEELATDIVNLFNSTGKADAAVTTKEGFQGSSHPNVKYVFSNPANLTKYKWMLEFIYADFQKGFAEGRFTAETFSTTYAELDEMLPKLIAGDTEIINDSRMANGRSCLRQYIHQLINAETPENTGHATYAAFVGDYSTEEMKAAILKAAGGDGFKFKPTDPLPVPVYEGHFFDGWFDEEGNKVEFVNKDCTLTAKWTALADKEFNVTFELAEGTWAEGYELPEKITGGFELPTPVKAGFTFVEWTDAEGNKVEKITADGTLTAKWEVTKFTVSLDANGGILRAGTIDDFALEMVELFNSPTEADKVTTTLTNFVGTTHPNVKYVFDDAETLAKYKWLLEYAKAEMEAIGSAELGADLLAAYDNTIEMLDKMIAGDTDAIKGSYANGRTALRQFIHRIINKGDQAYPGTTFYDAYIPDFSKPEKQAEFAKLLPVATKATEVMEINAALPTPTYEGFKFIGWFDAEGNKVETVTADCELVAKWEVPALAEIVVDGANKQIIGGTYITNNEKYPNPSFYKDGGLKMNYVNMGLQSEKFEAQNLLVVKLIVNALNENTKSDNPDLPAFTVYGFNEAGEQVAAASLDTIVVGENLFSLQGDGIVLVKVIMTDYPFNGEKCANVSVGKVIIDTVE